MKSEMKAKDGIRRGRFVEVPPRFSPGGGRKTTESLPKVAGLGRESNPGLPNERCVG